MALSAEKRRLKAIVDAIRAKTGGADLSRLDDGQLKIFEAWRNECKILASTVSDPGAYYAEYLSGKLILPILRSDVRIKLFGEYPRILISDTIEMAADKFNRFRDKSR